MLRLTFERRPEPLPESGRLEAGHGKNA